MKEPIDVSIDPATLFDNPGLQRSSASGLAVGRVWKLKICPQPRTIPSTLVGGWCILAVRRSSRREVPAAAFMTLRSNRADGVDDLIASPFPADPFPAD
jgi:hypothetical protein